MHALLGNILGKLSAQNQDPRQRQEAIEHYLTAARLKPDYGDAYRCLGFMELQQRPDKAEANFRRALELAPHDAQAWYGLGAVAAVGGDWALAERLFGQALSIDPGLTDARRDLALALANQHKLAEAARASAHPATSA